jgi:hypothetical protein
MYCQNCYAKLNPADDPKRCPKCNRKFDPNDPWTYHPRPFPDVPMIVWNIITTTLVGTVVAFVIATFQLAIASGH